MLGNHFSGNITNILSLKLTFDNWSTEISLCCIVFNWFRCGKNNTTLVYLLSSCRQVLNYFKTNMLIIILNDFSIWLLGYRTEFSRTWNNVHPDTYLFLNLLINEAGVNCQYGLSLFLIASLHCLMLTKFHWVCSNQAMIRTPSILFP